jgi:hypothetical protein
VTIEGLLKASCVCDALGATALSVILLNAADCRSHRVCIRLQKLIVAQLCSQRNSPAYCGIRNLRYVRVFTAVLLRIQFFQDMTPCRWVSAVRRFEGTECRLLQGLRRINTRANGMCGKLGSIRQAKHFRFVVLFMSRR